MKKTLITAFAVAALALPALSFAQIAPTGTPPDQQAVLQSLLKQIQALEAQVHVQSGTSTPTSTVAGAGAGAGVDAGAFVQLIHSIEMSTSTSSTIPTIPGYHGALCYTFNTNLAIGATGEAVLALQAALNADGETVALTGTYDAATAAAVKLFQQKHSGDVLRPSGLTVGTGFVGKGTRNFLNKLYRCGVTTTMPHSMPMMPMTGGMMNGTGTPSGTPPMDTIMHMLPPTPTSTATSSDNHGNGNAGAAATLQSIQSMLDAIQKQMNTAPGPRK